MAVVKSHAGWKSKDFRGMTFEQIEEKFIPVWKQLQDFVPMNFKDRKVKRVKRPRNFICSRKLQEIEDKASGSKPSKNIKPKIPIFYRLSRKSLNKMMEIKDLDRLWSLVKKTSSTTDPTEDKEKELWVKLKRLYEPDPRDYLWALQRYIYDPLEWRLYDTCGVHHVSTGRGHEIFMLVEKDYPLTKGLTTLLLCNKLQVDQYSEMANELLIKIYSIANSPR
ncbi:hypothetical protein Tco_0059410 [Tanacetum coccineum]